MGSFNVSCGITRLSIGVMDDCVLIPLIPKNAGYRYRRNTSNFSAVCPPVSQLVYMDDVWAPLTLPIRGEYNDYGGIEEIVHDENTEIIEEYFGMSIEDFTRYICDGRKDPYDTFSDLSEFYNNPEDLEEESIQNILQNLNFIVDENDGNHYWNDKCSIIFKTDETGYEICDVTYTQNNDHHKFHIDEIREFLTAYYKVTGDLLGIKKSGIVELLMHSSVMFILGEVYDFYAKNHMATNENLVRKFSLNGQALLQSGFIRKVDEDGESREDIFLKDGHSVDLYNRTLDGKSFGYDMKDFLKAYKKVFKEELDISKWNGMDSEDWSRENFLWCERNQIEEMLNLKGRTCYKENKELQLITYEDNDRIVFAIRGMSVFADIARTSYYLPRIYAVPALQTKALEKIYEFKRLLFSMRLSNVILMPGSCGTQVGCNEAENKLAFITSKIARDRLEESSNGKTKKFTEKMAMKGFNDRFY